MAKRGDAPSVPVLVSPVATVPPGLPVDGALVVAASQDEATPAPPAAPPPHPPVTHEEGQEDVVVSPAPSKAPPVDADPAPVQAALVAARDATLRQALRANLIGTIADWSAAGAAEIERVRDLLKDHADWSEAEVAAVGSAFERLIAAAGNAVADLATYRDNEWLQRVHEVLHAVGRDPADILDLNPVTRNVVMNDGERIEIDL